MWCQSLSLIVQLLVGIRFLDIRCRHYRNGLPIHHEAFFQKADLSDVLSTTVSFLSTHPSEVIFMRIKEEYDAEGNNRLGVSMTRYKMHSIGFPVEHFGPKMKYHHWANVVGR